MESLNLSFSRLTLSYIPQNPNGSPGTPVTVTFDLKSNKPIAQ